MANKSRLEIKNQIYEYLPQINQTANATLVNNVIDLALEEISNMHDFRCLRAASPDEATLAAGAYSLVLNSTNFTTMMGTTGYFKDIISMFMRKTGKDDYKPIYFLDDKEFHHRYGYVDYASRTRGYPDHYTRLENTLLFNCPAQESLLIRVYYQKYHPALASDSTTHSFDTKDNMVAFQAIVYSALVELKNSLNTVEFPHEMENVASMAKYYVGKLIARDFTRVNEQFEIGWAEKSDMGSTDSDPYYWK